MGAAGSGRRAAIEQRGSVRGSRWPLDPSARAAPSAAAAGAWPARGGPAWPAPCSGSAAEAGGSQRADSGGAQPPSRPWPAWGCRVVGDYTPAALGPGSLRHACAPGPDLARLAPRGAPVGDSGSSLGREGAPVQAHRHAGAAPALPPAWQGPEGAAASGGRACSPRARSAEAALAYPGSPTAAREPYIGSASGLVGQPARPGSADLELCALLNPAPAPPQPQAQPQQHAAALHAGADGGSACTGGGCAPDSGAPGAGCGEAERSSPTQPGHACDRPADEPGEWFAPATLPADDLGAAGAGVVPGAAAQAVPAHVSIAGHRGTTHAHAGVLAEPPVPSRPCADEAGSPRACTGTCANQVYPAAFDSHPTAHGGGDTPGARRGSEEQRAAPDTACVSLSAAEEGMQGGHATGAAEQARGGPSAPQEDGPGAAACHMRRSLAPAQAAGSLATRTGEPGPDAGCAWEIASSQAAYGMLSATQDSAEGEWQGSAGERLPSDGACAGAGAGQGSALDVRAGVGGSAAVAAPSGLSAAQEGALDALVAQMLAQPALLRALLQQLLTGRDPPALPAHAPAGAEAPPWARAQPQRRTRADGARAQHAGAAPAQQDLAFPAAAGSAAPRLPARRASTPALAAGSRLVRPPAPPAGAARHRVVAQRLPVHPGPAPAAHMTQVPLHPRLPPAGGPAAGAQGAGPPATARPRSARDPSGAGQRLRPPREVSFSFPDSVSGAGARSPDPLSPACVPGSRAGIPTPAAGAAGHDACLLPRAGGEVSVSLMEQPGQPNSLPGPAPLEKEDAPDGNPWSATPSSAPQSPRHASTEVLHEAASCSAAAEPLPAPGECRVPDSLAEGSGLCQGGLQAQPGGLYRQPRAWDARWQAGEDVITLPKTHAAEAAAGVSLAAHADKPGHASCICSEAVQGAGSPPRAAVAAPDSSPPPAGNAGEHASVPHGTTGSAPGPASRSASHEQAQVVAGSPQIQLAAAEAERPAAAAQASAAPEERATAAEAAAAEGARAALLAAEAAADASTAAAGVLTAAVDAERAADVEAAEAAASAYAAAQADVAEATYAAAAAAAAEADVAVIAADAAAKESEDTLLEHSRNGRCPARRSHTTCHGTAQFMGVQYGCISDVP